MKQRLYLAYGSNLNLDRMAARCPTAEVVGTTQIPGYDLKFRGRDGAAVATIEPGADTTPALLWAILPRDEAALDVYEGWPTLYRKEILEVELDNRPVSAMVYIMNEGRDLGRPPAGYLDTICDGYRSVGFDEAVLARAVERSISELSRTQFLLNAKIERDMQRLEKFWLRQSKSWLIQNAPAISATQMIRDDLMQSRNRHADYLLTLEHPLEAVRDLWLGEGATIVDDSLHEMIADMAEADREQQEEFTLWPS